jgi:Ger(x)C family germination protein
MRKVVVLIALLAALPLSGCWDRTEVNDVAIVLATAIDKEKDGYRLSVIIPLPGNLGGPSGGGGGTGGQKPYMVGFDTGATISEASSRLQSRLPRKLFYAHLKVVLIGEEMAKEGLRDVMDVLGRVPRNRLASSIAVTKGSAYEVLNTQPHLERFSAEKLRELLKSDVTIPIKIKTVASQLNKVGQDPIIPYVQIKQKSNGEKNSEILEIDGFVYTRDGKMIGVAEGDAAKGVRWLNRFKFHPYLETMRMKGGDVSVLIRRGSVSVKPRVVGGEPHFDIKVKAEGSIEEALDNRDYENETNIHELERQLEQNIERELSAALDIVKRQKSDIAGFGTSVYRAYPDLWDKWKRDWNERLSRASFHVTVRGNVNRAGKFSENIAKLGEKYE